VNVKNDDESLMSNIKIPRITLGMQKLIDQPFNSTLTTHPSVTVLLSPAIEV
jgi:hypothetical protein